jgi:hypothetical protein
MFINPSLYNAAFNGALAGQLAGNGLAGVVNTVNVDNQVGTYTPFVAIAAEFAKVVDATLGGTGVTNVSTSNATVVPSSNVIQSTQLALVDTMFALAFGYWYSRKSANISANPVTDPGNLLAADYTLAAEAVVTQFAAAQASFAAQSSLV